MPGRTQTRSRLARPTDPSPSKPPRPQIRLEDDSVDLSENDWDASALNNDGAN
jgi:hypothetical protein